MNFVVDFIVILKPVLVLVLIANTVSIVLQLVVNAYRGGF